ncbi:MULTISPECIES: response regulator transcription factor [Idiomarina]|mgnify:FL=1|uniref:response regulator transcription factor n=1 Tax=Idiomarina TaxID=135575 RepID=UPI000C09EB60|nr:MULTISPECIES: response regulator transcription factor [Idiomarina]RDX34118.1 DNA-binding response regulator [Idiomarina sp. HD9-110m-PIT-SAG04]MAB21541.1 DNA-binding response regulator [Idiomarina sp.]MAL83462.1 DNA-binding response regulator [Idiomarina sp.]MBE92446.1 DNA-binding response regulator [Idiomarina sp.]MBE92810.1 DNA-binding response regulator [Idiomarina sp.]
MARAIIADDHPLFRAAMKQALSDSLDSDIIEASSFSQLEQQLKQFPQIELVFLDLSMPGNRGLTGLSVLRSQFPDILVVIVSANEDTRVIRQAMALGASGYIPKSVPLPEWQTAVTTVLSGDNWLPESMLSMNLAEPDEEMSEFANKLEQLTPQQFKVLQCIADGLLNKQIAYELGVQETTIKQHASAILRKLNCVNRTQAGIMFREMLDTSDTLE